MPHEIHIQWWPWFQNFQVYHSILLYGRVEHIQWPALENWPTHLSFSTTRVPATIVRVRWFIFFFHSTFITVLNLKLKMYSEVKISNTMLFVKNPLPNWVYYVSKLKNCEKWTSKTVSYCKIMNSRCTLWIFKEFYFFLFFEVHLFWCCSNDGAHSVHSVHTQQTKQGRTTMVKKKPFLSRA